MINVEQSTCVEKEVFECSECQELTDFRIEIGKEPFIYICEKCLETLVEKIADVCVED